MPFVERDHSLAEKLNLRYPILNYEQANQKFDEVVGEIARKMTETDAAQLLGITRELTDAQQVLKAFEMRDRVLDREIAVFSEKAQEVLNEASKSDYDGQIEHAAYYSQVIYIHYVQGPLLQVARNRLLIALKDKGT